MAIVRVGGGAYRGRQLVFGGNKRAQGGSLSRFVGTSHHADRNAASLSANHPAVAEGRTLFPGTVVEADVAPRVLVSGRNSAKIGGDIRKGPWRGLAVYTLTLQERATCPAHCGLWRQCFGNAMPFARRHHEGPKLIHAIERDLTRLRIEHPVGIAVRLHVLGDFYSTEYVMQWAAWMNRFPRLRVWGYTAHRRDSEIGDLISQMNDHWPDRWMIRSSVDPGADLHHDQATTIWRQETVPYVAEGLICPMQQNRTACCSTCGLCWAPAMRATRIVFLGHGMKKR